MYIAIIRVQLRYGTSMRSRWLDIGQVLFCVFMDQVEVEVD